MLCLCLKNKKDRFRKKRLTLQFLRKKGLITIYARVIYTAQYVVVLMRANALTRSSGRGLNPGNREFFGPVKWQRAVRRVPFRAEIVINALDVYIVRCEVVFMRETSIQGAL